MADLAVRGAAKTPEVRKGISVKDGNSDTGLDNLSNADALLREVEVEQDVDNDDGRAFDARKETIDALRHYHDSRFNLGRALAAYKVFFIERGGWVQAAKVLGRAINRDEKTIFRIIEDYERASQVPLEALKELESQGIDPAARKNAAIIDNLLTMPRAEMESDPKMVVGVAVKAINAVKVAKKAKTPKKPCLSEPASVDTQCVPLTREERQRRDVRLKIRAALSNVQDERKLAELIAALEEEMYDVWGVHEPCTITLNPRPSALTIDGRRKDECAA